MISGLGEDREIPAFEPLGFEDAQAQTFGYGVLDWSDASLGQYLLQKNQSFAYQYVELRLLPEENQEDILRKINHAIKALDCNTFLRVAITGRSAFGLMIHVDALEKQLQKHVFFAEVYDNTVMDIDEEAFENDISLRSEFVRLALQDDSLSETERSRLISCGWNALNGREVSAE